MTTLLSDSPETVTPTPDDIRLAEENSRLLTRLVASKSRKPLRLRIESECPAGRRRF